jgi:hypothetical protein
MSLPMRLAPTLLPLALAALGLAACNKPAPKTEPYASTYVAPAAPAVLITMPPS